MGLLFIALNRIISPAFYAQGNTKLPTLAGIISFGANIVLALVFVRPFGGNGIALALTLASFVNTLFLFIFMKKLDSFKIRKVVFQTLGYILKMTVYSIIAAIPCYFVHSLLVKFFAENSRIVSYGIPVILTAMLFAIIGIAELIITKDEIIHTIIQKVKSKKG